MASEGDRSRRRRYRERCKQDVIVLPVPVKSCQLASALIASERLTEAQTGDRQQLAAAVGELVDEWCRRWPR